MKRSRFSEEQITQRKAVDAEWPCRELQWPPEGECLNEHLFTGLRHARYLIHARRDDYNPHRPHTRLDGLTPWEYHQRAREDQTLNRANP